MQAIEILYKKANDARLRAYAPYSHFLVGTCIESKNGNLYAAGNIENAAYGLSSCAEANAIALMLANGEKEIAQALIVVDTPHLTTSCGACRQRFFEFAAPSTPIHFANLQGSQKSFTLNALLPYAFGPAQLIPTPQQQL